MSPAHVPWTLCAEAHLETSLLLDHSLQIQPVAREGAQMVKNLHTSTHEKLLKEPDIFSLENRGLYDTKGFYLTLGLTVEDSDLSS